MTFTCNRVFLHFGIVTQVRDLSTYYAAILQQVRQEHHLSAPCVVFISHRVQVGKHQAAPAYSKKMLLNLK